MIVIMIIMVMDVSDDKDISVEKNNHYYNVKGIIETKMKMKPGW